MVQQTIRIYLLLTLLMRISMSFTFAMYVMFLMSRGLDLFEVNLINLVYFITLAIFEVPTGAIADVFGRKISFVLSSVVIGLGMFIYASSQSFAGFAIAEATIAIGATLTTGAFQAWLVDRLNYFGFNGTLKTVFVREQIIVSFGTITGALAGAHVADTNLTFPWIISGFAFMLTAILAQLLMREEYFKRQALSLASGCTSVITTMKAGIRYGLRHHVVRFLVFVGFIQLLGTQAANMQWQPLFSRSVPNVTSLGFIFVGVSVMLGLGALAAPLVVRTFRHEKIFLLWTQIGTGIGIALTVLAGSFPLALSAFLFQELCRGLFYPIKEAYLNANIPSRERATIISFESITRHIGGGIGLVASGYLAQQFSITTAWIFSAIVLFASSLALMRNHGKQ